MATAMTNPAYDTSYGTNAAENYERYFVPLIPHRFGMDLVAEARLRPGERVLDVACGTGIIARLAAEQIRPDGVVAGVDVNPAMLDIARAAYTGPRIRWYESSAESMPLPDHSFDVAFCQLGLQFIADRSAALRELRRVLVPGGRVYISTAVPNDFFDVLEREMARHVGPPAAAFVQAVFSLHDPGELSELLAGAGFLQPRVRLHRKRLQLPAPREFMWQYIHCTPLMAVLPQRDDARARALEEAVAAAWQPWRNQDGMSCEQTVLVGWATAPGV